MNDNPFLMVIRMVTLLGVTATIVATIGGRVGGQVIVDREAAVRLLEHYDRGLPANVRFAAPDSFDASLAAAAPAWIEAAPIAERARRRRIAALVAIEAYAAAGQPDIESACGWLRQGEPDAFERLWHLATLALISRQRAVRISRVAHFDHAASRFAEEPRFALAKLLLRPESYARSTRPVPRDTLARTIERGIVGSSFARQPNRIPRTLDDLQQFPLDDHTGAEARAHLGVVRFLLGDLAGSAREATTAAGATSDSFVRNLAWLTAGLAHARMGQPAQAMNAYRAATEAEPTAKASATLFAIHSFLNGDRSAAAAAVDAAYGSDAPAIDPWQQPNGDERFLRRYLIELRALVGYTGPPLTDLFPIPAWPGLAGTTAAMVPAIPRELERQAQSEARPQADDPTRGQVFRATARAVTVDVAVFDGRTPVQGLTVDDFEVFDNGVRQSLRAVSFDAVPLDVSLVLELSDPRLFSMRRPRPPYAPAQALRDAAEISAALRGIDRLRVMVVYAEPFEVIPLQAPGAPLHPLVRHWENTDITSALYDGTAAVIVRPTPIDRRHLVFLFTDGVDGTSVVDGELLLRAAPTTDAVIHVARRLTGPEIFAQENPRSNSRYPLVWPAQPRLIEQVAVATGGSVRHIDTESVAAHFQNVLKTFSQRYLLHFTPTDVSSSGWHELTVRVRGRPRYRVDARRGYFGNK